MIVMDTKIIGTAINRNPFINQQKLQMKRGNGPTKALSRSIPPGMGIQRAH